MRIICILVIPVFLNHSLRTREIVDELIKIETLSLDGVSLLSLLNSTNEYSVGESQANPGNYADVAVEDNPLILVW